MANINKLKCILEKYEKICVAYSGGVDSDFLLNVSRAVFGNNVIAIVASGLMLSKKDYDEAIVLLEKSGVKYYVIELDILDIEEFKNNDIERCYYCKKNVMGAIAEKAKELGFDYIADGKNADDGKSYRPGIKASQELGIISPLYEAGFTKCDIRSVAKDMGLSTWNKPSNSCLATRFPYNTVLNKENFAKVEDAEYIMAQSGIKSGRVRVHGDIARIEIPKEFFYLFTKDNTLSDKIKNIGFKYITLDLEGFRSGSMD